MTIKSRREHLRETTTDEIKALARQQMIEQGAAGISLRAIAKTMGMTPGALYRYFASYDDLITALIVDAFNALADHLEAAAAQSPPDPQQRLWAVLVAYRQWALDNRADFQLLYGNPIPGYHAPREVTVPAVIRGFAAILGTIADAHRQGTLHPTLSEDEVPVGVAEALARITARDGYTVPLPVLYSAITGWTRMHGIIMLELFNHLQPVIGDTTAFYERELAAMMQQMGMQP